MIAQDGKFFILKLIICLKNCKGVVFCPKYPHHRCSKLILRLMGPDCKNFIIDSLLVLCKLKKPPMPKVPQLTFNENHPNLLPQSVCERAFAVNPTNQIISRKPYSSLMLSTADATINSNSISTSSTSSQRSTNLASST